MVAAALVALACGAAAFVLAPLWRPQAPPAWEAERERLLAAREAAYRALREIELDHDTGKLDDADYVALRARYQADAVALVHRLDALAGPLGAPDGAARAVPPAGRREAATAGGAGPASPVVPTEGPA